MMSTKPNFTPRAKEVIKLAKQKAIQLQSSDVSLDHLLISVLDTDQTAILEIFSRINIDINDFKEFVLDHIILDPSYDDSELQVQTAKYSKDFQLILNKSNDFANELNHGYVGLEHIFFIMLVDKSSPLRKYFDELGVDCDNVSEFLKIFLTGGDYSHLLPSSPAPADEPIQEESFNPSQGRPKRTERGSALQKFAKNYNVLASEGKFDKVICKEGELEKISEILCRRNKNNPILIGLPGTGKTSLVEGLAERIVNNKASDLLCSKIIYEVDLASMIAGTKYRGQFEQRLKQIIEEAKASSNVVLFIDEIHTLIGAGSAEGSMDAANILKPALARGDIRCIGATTPKEYSRSIMKDGALDRRFQEVNVEEPSCAEAIKILEGVAPKYEEFHHVKYRKNIFKLAVDLSIKYMNDKYLPDKAIDILDQAGARVKMRNLVKPAEALAIEDQIGILVREGENEIIDPQIKRKREGLLIKYEKILNDWSEDLLSKSFYVTQKDIYDVVSSKTGVPVNNISQKESEMLLKLEKSLNKVILFQEEAVSTICKSILRAKSGLKDDFKPIGSFLLLGETGTGKTFSAKALAKLFFGSEKNLIHVDMSEYSEKSNTSRLTGASPGYVGYEEGGQLTEKIRKNPYSVLLLDEIEKAHPSVIHTLLQVLEEGRITDGLGRVADFKNCIIIMTGNLGANLFDKETSIGFSNNKSNIDSKISEKAKDTFSPEFINRIDGVVVFKTFSKDHIKFILKSHIKSLVLKLKKKGIKLVIGDDIVNRLSDLAFAEKMGARPVNRLIRNKIENILSKKILKKKKGLIKLDLTDID